jgi:hypothetical protein
MRLSVLVLAAMMASQPAAADDWKEYTYLAYGFAIQFPGKPKVQDSSYRGMDGASAPARIYSLEQGGGTFRMTVANFSRQTVDEKRVIDSAIGVLSQSGAIRMDVPDQVNNVWGRQLTIANADGGHTKVAVFYYQRRLYLLEGIVPGAHVNTGAADALRFEQSLRFTNDASRLNDIGGRFGGLGGF